MEAPIYYSRYAKTIATRANLPHWSQRCACFLTFRLEDSLPHERLAQMGEERQLWLAAHPQPWNDEAEHEYFELFENRVQKWLDAGSGSCLLERSDIRQVVEETLEHFAEIRYSLYAYIVMPNHVHVLFMPNEGQNISEIVRDWKGFSSRAINRIAGRTGPLWQKESWDRLVRNVEQFNAYRAYIRGNCPSKAFDAYR